MKKEEETAIKFANWMAKYQPAPIPEKPGKWWFNEQNGTNPEKTTLALFVIAKRQNFK